MKLLHDFHIWVLALRRSGTSSLLERIAKANDVYVLVPTAAEKRDPKWHGKALCFDDLRKDGLKPKPLLLDNHAMLKFSELAYEYSRELEGKVRDRNRLLQKIKAEILTFETKAAPSNDPLGY